MWRLVRDPEEMRFVQHSYTSDVLYGDRFKVPDVADWDGIHMIVYNIYIYNMYIYIYSYIHMTCYIMFVMMMMMQ